MIHTATPFQIESLGLVMEADTAHPDECEGVLNPAAARGPDGSLYLLPRLVGQGNYSRVGCARVQFNAAGDPTGVERLGYALEPSTSYELRPTQQTGGCEDPRVTYVEPLQRYVMVYTAWGTQGPRLALAVSEDARRWQRLGLVTFAPRPDPLYGVVFGGYDNKDGALFPQAVTAPDGAPALALLHRPVYRERTRPTGVADPRPSIWISYCALADAQRDVRALATLRQHHVLLTPTCAWEQLRIGVGTPPVRTPLGWLVLYHGVARRGALVPAEHPAVQYSAGVLVLAIEDPRQVLYRSPSPVMMPDAREAGAEVLPRVVFPTGVDVRGQGRLDIYYGLADRRIGAARLRVPESIPTMPA